MDAPDRIRVARDSEGFWTCREAISGSQEYVRADLYAKMVAERDDWKEQAAVSASAAAIVSR